MVKLPKKRTVTAPARLWKRLLAFIVDLLILDILVVEPFKRILANQIPSDIETITKTAEFIQANQSVANISTITVAIITVLFVTYFTVLEWKFGQTIGKLLFNIRVEGKKLTIWHFVIRNLFLIPFFPFIILWLVEPLYILFTKEHQRLLEKITNTMVVEDYPV